jgi:2-polyprenyl-3-methyl-5-hydroxy-6-metoxy-1,4-benzoquinol methylase
MEKIYRFDPNPLNTHFLLLSEVPPNSRVLEIGTASGYMGEYLIREKHCTVWGIEPIKEYFDDAKKYGYERIFELTTEQFLEQSEVKEQKFDVVFIGDVLEHMVHPDQVLEGLKKLLRPEGIVVISLPNIAHYTTRWQLLTGRWDMQDGGILDRTHLRFFTLKTMRALIENSGFEIKKVRPSSGYIERFGLNKLMGIGRKVLFAWPELFAVQFIFVATPKK